MYLRFIYSLRLYVKIVDFPVDKYLKVYPGVVNKFISLIMPIKFIRTLSGTIFVCKSKQYDGRVLLKLFEPGFILYGSTTPSRNSKPGRIPLCGISVVLIRT